MNAEIARRGARRVAVFGTRYTMDSKAFGLLEGVEVVHGRPEAKWIMSMRLMLGR